jgi:hypothetical protein
MGFQEFFKELAALPINIIGHPKSNQQQHENATNDFCRFERAIAYAYKPDYPKDNRQNNEGCFPMEHSIWFLG